MTAVVTTTTGLAWLADKAVDLATATGPGTTTEWWIGFGTGGSSTGATATAGNTALAAAATEALVAATVTQPTAPVCQFVATITCGRSGGFTVEEAGLFTATAGGVMAIRGSHAGVGLATGDSIQYTITETFAG